MTIKISHQPTQHTIYESATPQCLMTLSDPCFFRLHNIISFQSNKDTLPRAFISWYQRLDGNFFPPSVPQTMPIKFKSFSGLQAMDTKAITTEFLSASYNFINKAPWINKSNLGNRREKKKKFKKEPSLLGFLKINVTVSIGIRVSDRWTNEWQGFTRQEATNKGLNWDYSERENK